MTNLVPGAVLQLHPADWRDSYGKPLHMQITRVSRARSMYDRGVWVYVEGHDLDATGTPIAPIRQRTAYVRLAATTDGRPNPPN